MGRELLLLRHGKTHTHAEGGDKKRELKDSGKRDAQRIGVWLAQHDKRPDMILCSTATRAKRTAEKACKTAGLSADTIQFHERLYNAHPQDIFDMICAVANSTQRLLIVGHNPSLEILVNSLCPAPLSQKDYARHLSPADLAVLSVPCDWEDIELGTCTLQHFIQPETLPRLFPFPDIHGNEQRARPAYYYTQSSVVPYRIVDGDIEVLIILSSKHKHWVMPKGIHDPGLSAQASAAKEAFEEAGIEGRVWETVLDIYSYPKWDAVCTVSVYPMEVTRILHETDWPESHRGRKWVSVNDAASMVKDEHLKRIIAMLPEALAKGTP